jgi:hypothetical protein
MASGEDWLLRPVAAGMCLYESLLEPGKIDLGDIADMNEFLDVKDENERRYTKANEKKS